MERPITCSKPRFGFRAFCDEPSARGDERPKALGAVGGTNIVRNATNQRVTPEIDRSKRRERRSARGFWRPNNRLFFGSAEAGVPRKVVATMAGEVTLAESEFNARMRETARRVLGKLIERRRNSPPGVGRGGERRHSLRIKALPTPSYTERARTQAIAVAGADSGSGPCDANNTSGAANQRRNSVSNWSWEDSDASNDSFGNGESDRRSGGRANVNKGSPGHAPNQTPAGPSFVKVMAPGHISGHFYVDAPCGLSDWLPDETATLVLECDGEEWKTVWLVETKGGDKSAGLSGGWRGFAVDQRLAVGDALVFTKERGARVSVRIHRCGTGGVGRDGGRRTGGARCPPGVRQVSESAARSAAFTDAEARTDAFVRFAAGETSFAALTDQTPHPQPRCGGTCRSLHVYSRRRQGRYDAVAAAAARRRTGASPDECADIARTEMDGVRGAGGAGHDQPRHGSRLIHAAHDAGSPSRWKRAGMVSSPPAPAKDQLPFASPKAGTPKKNARRRPTSQISSSPSDPAAPLGSPGKVTPAPPGTTEREANAAAAAVAPLKEGVPARRTRRQSTGGGDRCLIESKPPSAELTWATPAVGGGVLARDASGDFAVLPQRRSLRLGEEETPAMRTAGCADVPPPAPKAIRSRPPRRCAPVRIPDEKSSKGGLERGASGEGTPLSQVFRSTKRARTTPMFVTPV